MNSRLLHHRADLVRSVPLETVLRSAARSAIGVTSQVAHHTRTALGHGIPVHELGTDATVAVAPSIW